MEQWRIENDLNDMLEGDHMRISTTNRTYTRNEFQNHLNHFDYDREGHIPRYSYLHDAVREYLQHLYFPVNLITDY